MPWCLSYRTIPRSRTDEKTRRCSYREVFKTLSWKVMENSPPGTENQDISQGQQAAQNYKMSMIAMATPTPHAPFRRDFWDETRSADYAPSRPRSDTDRIALPSIRQVNLHQPLF